MKSSVKHQREKNSLETFLLDLVRDYKENKTRILQGVLVFLVAVAAFLFIRFYYFGSKTAAQNSLDDAYYLATNQSFLSFTPAPDPAPYQELTAKYGSGDVGALARLSLGEAKLKTGQTQIEQKRMNSKAEYNDEAVAALDPITSLNEALAAFDELINKNMTKDASLKARAVYNAGAVCETLAGVAADEAAVSDLLDKAKSRYAEVAACCADSPYAALAAERSELLNQPLAAAFYQQVAESYRTMPVPPPKPASESILSETPGETLDPADNQGFDILNELPKTDDAAEPATEEPATDAPATEEPAANAEPAAPAAEAPAAEAPAADAPAEQPAPAEEK